MLRKIIVSFSFFLTMVCSAQTQVVFPMLKVDAMLGSDIGVTANIKGAIDFAVNPHFRIGPGGGVGAMDFFADLHGASGRQLMQTYEAFADVKWLKNPEEQSSFLLGGQLGLMWDGKHSLTGNSGVLGYVGPTISLSPGMDIAKQGGSLQVTCELRWQQIKRSALYGPLNEFFVGIGLAYQWGKR